MLRALMVVNVLIALINGSILVSGYSSSPLTALVLMVAAIILAGSLHRELSKRRAE